MCSDTPNNWYLFLFHAKIHNDGARVNVKHKLITMLTIL